MLFLGNMMIITRYCQRVSVNILVKRNDTELACYMIWHIWATQTPPFPLKQTFISLHVLALYKINITKKEQSLTIQGTVAQRPWQQQWRKAAQKVLALPEAVQIRKRTEVLGPSIDG